MAHAWQTHGTYTTNAWQRHVTIDGCVGSEPHNKPEAISATAAAAAASAATAVATTTTT